MARQKGSNEKSVPVKFDIPEGFRERSADLVGFFDAEHGTCRFIPTSAKAIDNGADARKVSALIICEYVSGPVVDADGEPVAAAEGDLVGLWYKPGMKGIANLRGEETILAYSHEIDTGKPNPMKVFRVYSRNEGLPMEINEDHRKTSKTAELPFPLARVREQSADRKQRYDDNDPDWVSQ